VAVYQIDKYYVRWEVPTHEGYIMLYTASGAHIGSITQSDFSGPEEFRLVWEMLRREEPLYYDSVKKLIRTAYTGVLEEIGKEDV